MSNTISIAQGWIGLSLLAMLGCGGPAYEYDSVVTGTVTVGGELANSGTVTFHPVGDGRPAVGQIHSDGSYSLRTGQGDLQQVDGGTVMPGEYLVTVNITAPPAEGSVVAEGGPPIPGPSLIASKYAQKSTTDLRYTVKPGPQVIVLNLELAEAEPADESAESLAEGGEAQTTEAEGTEAAETTDQAEMIDEADDSQPAPPQTAADEAETSKAASPPEEAAEQEDQPVNPEEQAP